MRDPERFGFKLPPVDEPFQVEEVITSKQLHLKTRASSLGITVDDLNSINPALRKEMSPEGPYSLKVPAGTAHTLQARLYDMPVWKPPAVIAPAAFSHRVCPGETLATIAARYGTTVPAIMSLNGLKKSGYIKQGWRLKIPSGAKRGYAAKKTASGADRSQQAGREYVVKRGDTLWKIASQFGTSAKELQAVNRLRSTGLSVGQVLVIPGEPADIGS